MEFFKIIKIDINYKALFEVSEIEFFNNEYAMTEDDFYSDFNLKRDGYSLKIWIQLE